VDVLLASKPVKLMVAPVPAQTAAAREAPVNVGVGFTLKVTFCVNDAEQLGEALVTVIQVICNVCPLLGAVRFAEVKLATPPALATTPVTGVCVVPLIE
jgi:hypothetical protein